MSFTACTTAQPMRCVNETLPPRALARWLLITVRLSMSSLAGTARTEVAVGTVRLVSMLSTTRAAAPRSGMVSISSATRAAASTAGTAAGAGAAAGAAQPAAVGAAAAGVGAARWSCRRSTAPFGCPLPVARSARGSVASAGW